MLWTSVDKAHAFLVDKPSHMTREDAPASAYLRAVPNCSHPLCIKVVILLWYCYSHCKSASVPAMMNVENVFGEGESDIKPVPEWDMKIPAPVKALCNKYETDCVVCFLTQ